MKNIYDNLLAPIPSCRDGMEEALNLYIDGELAFENQPPLFSHLAVCDSCRRTLEATMDFRRMSRQEVISVPAAVDDQFFQKLNQVKKRAETVDRWADRRPLWQAKTRVSLRVATTVALFLFLAGVFVPMNSQDVLADELVEGVEERIEFMPRNQFRGEVIYVFYPGLTVEAAMPEEIGGAVDLTGAL